MTDDTASRMRETMAGQGAELARLLRDDTAVAGVAERLRGREVVVAGTGTSWHAANQGARLLRLAGVAATAAQSSEAALEGPVPGAGGVLVALTHTGRRKRFTARTMDLAREQGAEVVQISGEGVEGADLHTVAQERSPAYTASHLGALMRLAQVARALGADLDALDRVPDAVDRAFTAPLDLGEPPQRLMELTGGGINAWTAAEGALKIREAAFVASEGLAVEQFLHGPAVALGPEDRLVVLDGGGPWSERLREVGDLIEGAGTPVTRVEETSLGEALSIFPLTVAVQRIALETAEARGISPDTFGLERPRHEGWKAFVANL
jgi:glucosamine--fructose-6-phosphate aminotransferase (isomerizing)